MITLTLLHPLKQNPVQTWTFPDQAPLIRIGRSTENHVVLYSAVVSRRHVELRRVGANWEVVSLGTNGTYLDGKRITHVAIVDGAIIRLARSGPNIQIRLETEALKNLPEAFAGDSQNAASPHQPPFKPSQLETDITDQTSGEQPDEVGKPTRPGAKLTARD